MLLSGLQVSTERMMLTLVAMGVIVVVIVVVEVQLDECWLQSTEMPASGCNVCVPRSSASLYALEGI